MFLAMTCEQGFVLWIIMAAWVFLWIAKSGAGKAVGQGVLSPLLKKLF